MRTGSSFSAAFIRSSCICRSGSSCWFQLLEIAGAFRPALREAAGFVLGLAFAGCLLALTLGYLLAYGSGDAGTGRDAAHGGRNRADHRRAGVPAGAAVVDRTELSQCSIPRCLPACCCCCCGRPHQGGSITHGSNYLTAYMPARLKRLLTLERAGKDAAWLVLCQAHQPDFRFELRRLAMARQKARADCAWTRLIA